MRYVVDVRQSTCDQNVAFVSSRQEFFRSDVFQLGVRSDCGVFGFAIDLTIRLEELVPAGKVKLFFEIRKACLLLLVKNFSCWF
jgi:hypothetical protein